MRSRWQGRLALAAVAGTIFSGLYAPAQQIGGSGGVPGSSSSGNAVTSVFSRAGDIAAETGDYTAAQVTNAAATNTANTFAQPNTYASGMGITFLSTGDHTWNLSAGTTASKSALNIEDVTNSQNLFSLFGYDSGDGAGGLVLRSSDVTTKYGYAWSSGDSYTSAVTTGLWNPSAGVVEVGSGNAANANGMLLAAAIGSGTSNNTDLRGKITLSSGSGSYTFSNSYSVAPICVATDTTTAAPIKVTVTTTTLTLTGTGSDVLNYICAD